MKEDAIWKEIGVWIVYDLEANREIQKLLQKKKFAFRFDPNLEIIKQSERKRILEELKEWFLKLDVCMDSKDLHRRIIWDDLESLKKEVGK